MAASHIFKVIFHNQGKVFEIYARKVGHGSMFGFIEVEELIFGEKLDRGRRPVRGEDPDRVRGREAHLPAAALGDPHRRGAQVRASARCRRPIASNVAQFPFPVYTPPAAPARAKSRARRGLRRCALARTGPLRYHSRLPADRRPPSLMLTLQRRSRALGFPARQGPGRRPRPGRRTSPAVDTRYVHFVDARARRSTGDERSVARGAAALRAGRRQAGAPAGRAAAGRAALRHRVAVVDARPPTSRTSAASPPSRRIERGVAYYVQRGAAADRGRAARGRRAASTTA